MLTFSVKQARKSLSRVAARASTRDRASLPGRIRLSSVRRTETFPGAAARGRCIWLLPLQWLPVRLPDTSWSMNPARRERRFLSDNGSHYPQSRSSLLTDHVLTRLTRSGGAMIRFRVAWICLAGVALVSAAAGLRGAAIRSLRIGNITPARPMIDPRSGHTATLLPDGKVLIAGGMRRNQDFYKSAELYDPSTATFVRTGEMSIGRVGQIAVLLETGKVLVTGGWIGH